MVTDLLRFFFFLSPPGSALDLSKCSFKVCATENYKPFCVCVSVCIFVCVIVLLNLHFSVCPASYLGIKVFILLSRYLCLSRGWEAAERLHSWSKRQSLGCLALSFPPWAKMRYHLTTKRMKPRDLLEPSYWWTAEETLGATWRIPQDSGEVSYEPLSVSRQVKALSRAAEHIPNW